VEWNDNSNNEQGFQIYRSTDGVSFSKHSKMASNRTSFSDTRLVPGRTYHYRVTAFNRDGESAPSNTLEVEVGAGGAPPISPSGLTATALSTTEIDLEWVDNSGDEVTFRIERSLNGVSYSEIDSVVSDETTYSVTGLDPDTQYWFRVRARNGSGSSAYSNIATATTMAEGGGPVFGDVYVSGGQLGPRFSARKFNSTATAQIWGVNHGANVLNLAVDSSDNVYTVGLRIDDLTLRKYDSSGNLLWSRDHGATSRAVFVDAAGNVHTGGDRVGDLTTRKYNSSGDLLWSVDHGAAVFAIAVDGAGNVYTGGGTTGSGTTRKYDSSGNLLWSFDHQQFVYAIGVDSDGNVYMGGNTNNDNQFNLVKLDSAGNFVWGYETDLDEFVSVDALVIDSTDNIYVGTSAGYLPNQIYKLTPAGGLVWSANFGGGINGIASICLDGSEDVIVGAMADSDNALGKFLGLDGTPVFSRPAKSTGFGVYRGCAVDSLGNILVGGSLSSDWNAMALDSEGEILLGLDTSDNGGCCVTANGIVSDAAGNIYVAQSDTNTTKKYSATGDLLWQQSHGTVIFDIAVDPSGNVITGGNRVGNLTTRKYNSAGAIVWSRDHGAAVNGVAVDADGNVYTGGARIGNLTTRKYDPDGTLVWSRDHGATVNGIAVDADGNVYTVGNRVSNLTTRKYDPDGTLVWSRDHGAAARGVAADADGNVYTVGARVGNLTTRKYDLDGALLWSRDHGTTTNRVVVDADGNVYTAGLGVGGNAARKYDASGTLLWSLNTNGSGLNSIAVPLPW
jgi:hypothetical protein